MIEHERSGPLDLLTWCFSRVVMWGPALIVMIILYEVIARYFFAAATLWANELSLWLGGGIFLSAGLYSMQQRSHIRIFILYDIVPLWLKRVFDLISVLCVCIFAFSIVWGGFNKAVRSFSTWELFGSAFDPPIPATTKPLILVLMLFLALQVLSNLVRDWPAASWIRKAFDVLVTAIIVVLAVSALYWLFSAGKEQLNIPIKWQVGISAFLISSIVIVTVGLIRDFNRDPIPHVEVDEREKEVAALKETVSPAQGGQ